MGVTDFELTSEQYERQIEEAASVIREKLGSAEICIVLGSGLNSFADTAFGDDVKSLSYADVPFMPETAVVGHYGRVFLGKLHNRACLCFAGRYHSYEGYPGHVVTFLPRLAAAVGCRVYILTNAAGGAGAEIKPGCGVAITDHMQTTCWNPLAGTATTRAFPLKFESESGVYDPELIRLAHEIAKEANFPLYDGVYCWNSGPTYETPAEIQSFVKLGATTFGMSSVPEAVAAREIGMNVFGLSLVTNMAAGCGHEELTHEDVSRVAKLASEGVSNIVSELVRRCKIPEALRQRSDVDSVTKKVAETSPVVAPNIILPTSAVAKADAETLCPLAAPLFLTVTGMTAEQAGLTVEKEGPALKDLESFKGVKTTSRAALIAKFAQVKTASNHKALALLCGEYAEGLAAHESIVALIIAIAAGARAVHGVVPAHSLASETGVVHCDGILNGAADPISPPLPRLVEGVPLPSIDEVGKTILSTMPGPILPSPACMDVRLGRGASVLTVAGSSHLAQSRGLGIPVSATAVVKADVSAIAKSIEVAVKQAESLKGEFHADRLDAWQKLPHEYHLFTPSLGCAEQTKKLADEAKAQLKLGEYDRVLCVPDTAVAREALRKLGEVAIHEESGIAHVGDMLVALIPEFDSGHSSARHSLPLRVAHDLGARKALFVVDAITKNGVIAVRDHINLTGENSLRGVNVDAWGTRFPDVTTLYTVLGDNKGTAVWILGTNESVSPAEVNAARKAPFLADAVCCHGGPQAVYAARHAGMRVAAFAGDVSAAISQAAEALPRF